MSKVVPLAKTATRKQISDYGHGPLQFHGPSEDVIRQVAPALPMYILKPAQIQENARQFVAAFPGKTMFAVKTNPHKEVIRNLYKGGVHAFDVASIEEVRLVRKAAPKAELFFMHPVKSPEAIREAYHVHGVRSFTLDTEDEMYKIIRETDLASDLKLYVRLALPKNDQAAIDFSGKFGAMPDYAARLLQRCRSVSETLGLCFHVGTQIHDPYVYENAVKLAASVIAASGVKIDVLDVGGGFPVPYPGEDVPTLEKCISVIKDTLAQENLDHLPLLAEPGRVLVAQAGSLVVRVELRKGQTLYLNDGTYGGLFDAGALLNTRYPVQAVRARGTFEETMQEFRFAGPTCDSLDTMQGPFVLPADIRMGDWIEIGNLGAYSQSMRTNFNGFGHADTAYLFDEMPKKVTRKGRKDV